MSKLLIRRIFVVVFALLVFLFVFVSYYKTINEANDTWREIEKNQMALTELEKLSSLVRDAQRAERGFIITNERRYLDPYYEASTNIATSLGDLENILKKNPELRNDLVEARVLLSEIFKFHDTIIELEESGQHAKVVENIKRDVGNNLIENFWGVLERINLKEKARLQKLREIYTSKTNYNFYQVIVVFITFILFLLYSYFKIIKEERDRNNLLKDLSMAKTELGSLNKELEKKVAQRTDELNRLLEDASLKNMELKKLNSMLDDFVFAAAHDLKAPVSNIKGLSALIASKHEFTDSSNLVSKLSLSAERLGNTIDGLVKVIEVQSNNNNTSFRYVLFEEVLTSAITILERQINELGAEVVYNFNEMPGITYVETYLQSIFVNFLSNSIKYKSNERDIEISVRSTSKNGFVVIYFKDNGIGINLEKHKDKLFKPFSRLVTFGEGTGIGLHLIKSMVEKNGGRVEVESAPGTGTCFEVWLKQMEV